MLEHKDKNGCEVDWEKLEKTVRTAVHFLDNVIDVNKYPLDKIDETTKATRKIGLGVMGFADMLLLLGISYNSDEAVAAGREDHVLHQPGGTRGQRGAGQSSGALSPCLRRASSKTGRPARNGTVTTIAPTGTLSIIAGCSSGVEPVFAYVFIRNVMDGTELHRGQPGAQAAAGGAGPLLRRADAAHLQGGDHRPHRGDPRGHPPGVCLRPRCDP